MEITKREKLLDAVAVCEKSGREFTHIKIADLKEALAGLAGSPAPTPPLDVEAEKRITEIRERESKATTGPWKAVIDGYSAWIESEKETVLPFFPPAKGSNVDFVVNSRLDIPFLLEQISLLRRHIASPAPRSCPKCGSPVCQPYKSTDDDLWTQRCNKCEWFEKWSGLASPAQPEKRDEWVSVEESGLPKVGHWCWVVYHGAVQRMAAQLAGKGFSCADGYEWRWADDSADPCPLEEITHWQPLPAPPQSGKENGGNNGTAE